MSDCWMIPQEPRKGDMIVVINACDRDGFLMTKSLHWMAELDGVNKFDAMIVQDESMYVSLSRELVDAARKAFRSVTVFRYPMPPEPKWPNGANWAFQSTAWHMMNFRRPWFWMEADCIPLKPGWLRTWQDEYDRCGKLVMGPIVKGRGWINGTAVYPHTFPEISPTAMRATDFAWDWCQWADIRHITHDAGHLLQHVWGIEDGKAHPYSGTAATFNRQEDVDEHVDPKAIMFHRAKFGCLIDRLRERRARQLHANRNSGSLVPQR